MDLTELEYRLGQIPYSHLKERKRGWGVCTRETLGERFPIFYYGHWSEMENLVANSFKFLSALCEVGIGIGKIDQE